jgi:hypothetical protein
MPFLYASKSLSAERSPPMATIPSGEAVATGGKYSSRERKYMILLISDYKFIIKYIKITMGASFVIRMLINIWRNLFLRKQL